VYSYGDRDCTSPFAWLQLAERAGQGGKAEVDQSSGQGVRVGSARGGAAALADSHEV
jgi:hypothetical protein